MHIHLEDQIGTIVVKNYKAAAVFNARGIDFCCRGNRSLQDVILEKGIVAEDIVNELNQIDVLHVDSQTDYTSWPLSKIIDEIEKKHHTITYASKSR